MAFCPPGEPTRGRGLRDPALRLSLFSEVAHLQFCIFRADDFRPPRVLLPRERSAKRTRRGLTNVVGNGLSSALPLHDPLRQVEDILRSQEVELRCRLLLHDLVKSFQRIRLTDPLEESLSLVKMRMDGKSELG